VNAPPCVGCGPAEARTYGPLRLATALSAGLSLAALAAHVFEWLDMRFFLVAFGAPSVVFVIAVAAYARLVDASVFLHNLILGLVVGLVATFVYDAVRIGLMWTNFFTYDAFYAIHVFGSWIARQPANSGAATTAGWLYHFWNGLSFGVMFALTFGRPRSWVYGLVYGIVMEVVMLGLFPMFLRVTDETGFVTISLIGHAAFGATLGGLTARHGRGWIADPA
jgi:hypothetical protein